MFGIGLLSTLGVNFRSWGAGTNLSREPVVTVSGLLCPLVPALSVPHVSMACVAPPRLVGTVPEVVVRTCGLRTVSRVWLCSRCLVVGWEAEFCAVEVWCMLGGVWTVWLEV